MVTRQTVGLREDPIAARSGPCSFAARYIVPPAREGYGAINKPLHRYIGNMRLVLIANSYRDY
jgi:hypothetical protein